MPDFFNAILCLTPFRWVWPSRNGTIVICGKVEETTFFFTLASVQCMHCCAVPHQGQNRKTPSFYWRWTSASVALQSRCKASLKICSYLHNSFYFSCGDIGRSTSLLSVDTSWRCQSGLLLYLPRPTVPVDAESVSKVADTIRLQSPSDLPALATVTVAAAHPPMSGDVLFGQTMHRKDVLPQVSLPLQAEQ